MAYGNGRVPSDAWDIARQIAGWISPQQWAIVLLSDITQFLLDGYRLSDRSKSYAWPIGFMLWSGNAWPRSIIADCVCTYMHGTSGNAWLLFASMFRYYCTIGCISARPRSPLSNQTFYPQIVHVTKSLSISLCGLSAQSLNFMSFQHNIVSFKWFCLVFCRPQIHICDKLSGNAWLDSCM